MLETIITNTQIPAFILIQDENTSRALNLYKGILKREIENNNVKEIHMICTRHPPEFYPSTFHNKKIHTYNLFKDPCCWIESSSFDCDTLFSKILDSQELQSTIMIDSINLIILMEDINYVCSFLHKIKEKFMRVVCLVQGDSINNTIFSKKLFFFSSIFLKVHQLNNSDRHCLFIEGIYKKQSGKVVAIKELCKIDENHVIHSEVFDDKRDNSKSCTTSSMRGLTTFRMGLDIKENEKIARDNLILPYLRTANKKCPCEGEKPEGKIVYCAESGDELEEDPDDDLDI